MTNISNNNISLREELAIAYECETFEREAVANERKARKEARTARKVMGARKEAERLYAENGYWLDTDSLKLSNRPLAIAYDCLLEEKELEWQREAEKRLSEIGEQIKQTCAYCEAHADDRASLCGLVALLDMYSDTSKEAFGHRLSGYWYMSAKASELVETVTLDEIGRFWELLQKNGEVAPYEKI